MSQVKQQRTIDAALDRLEASKGLTPEGRDWLIAALDPFHDSELTLAGYPDVLTASTVVQLVKQQLQITVPTTGPGTVTAGNNWDCDVVMWPMLAVHPVGISSIVSPVGIIATGAGGSGFDAGGLTVSAGPQGNGLWPTNTLNNTSATYTQLNPLPYIKGQGRVIGMGFEVVNTTAEINKQGQVTAWRQPTKWTPTSLNVATTPSQYVNGLTTRLPPSTIAQCQLLYGSRSWAAAEGAYVVSRQNGEDNPARIPSFQSSIYTSGDFASGVQDIVYTENVATTFNGSQVTNSDWYLPFDLSGVHFTGLSFATTLTVNVRWLIERIPGPLEADLVVLATPSCPYDPLALDIYCRCLRDMPPGVMLKENPLGEWFSKVLSTVGNIAPKIGDFLSPIIPAAGMIGKVVGGGANFVSNLNTNAINKAKEKKMKKQTEDMKLTEQKRVPLSDSRSHPVATPHYR
jgi:hypothetical protein